MRRRNFSTIFRLFFRVARTASRQEEHVVGGPVEFFVVVSWHFENFTPRSNAV